MPVHVTSNGWQEYTKFWGKMLGLNIQGCVAKDNVPHVILNHDGNTYFLLPMNDSELTENRRMGIFSELLLEYGRQLKDFDLGRNLARRFYFLQSLQAAVPSAES